MLREWVLERRICDSNGNARRNFREFANRGENCVGKWTIFEAGRDQIRIRLLQNFRSRTRIAHRAKVTRVCGGFVFAVRAYSAVDEVYLRRLSPCCCRTSKISEQSVAPKSTKRLTRGNNISDFISSWSRRWNFPSSNLTTEIIACGSERYIYSRKLRNFGATVFY